jgi:2-polyprenyl-3-methyl-5-hydroxy-6-metoxy-1,4-benzoquinol methylase
MIPANPEFVAKVEAYAAKHGGKVYAPLQHPDLDHIRSFHGHQRRDILFPLIGSSDRTFLDIGANWGYWSRSLEEGGSDRDITAVEGSAGESEFLKELHRIHENRFKIIVGDVLDLPAARYDVVLAMAIFHHFLKSKKKFDRFVAFLGRLEVRTMFFETHDPKERQMTDAYRNMEPDEFAAFVAKHLRRKSVDHVGTVEKRRLYRIS